MRRIEDEEGFRIQEYVVQMESNQYRDFEILDVPSLTGGSHGNEHLKAVEQITERYVLDPVYLIVQVKSAPQIGVVCSWMNRFPEFSLIDLAPCGSKLPPRKNYEDFTITIRTKFDLASNEEKMSKRKKNYPNPTKIVDEYKADALRRNVFQSHK